MRAGCGAGGFQKLEGALQVCFYICPWCIDRIADTGLRGEVQDMRRLVFGEEVRKDAWCLDAGLDAVEIVVARKDAAARAFERRVIIFGKGVDAEYAPAFVEPALGKVKTDEPGGTRDQRGFQLPPPAISLRYRP